MLRGSGTAAVPSCWGCYVQALSAIGLNLNVVSLICTFSRTALQYFNTLSIAGSATCELRVEVDEAQLPWPSMSGSAGRPVPKWEDRFLKSD